MQPAFASFLAPVLVCLVAALCVRAARSRISVGRLSKARGCKPAKTKESSWDLLGIRDIIRMVRAVLSGKMLDYMDALCETHGETYTASLLGQDVTFTCDIAVIKQVLTSQWSDYYAGKHLRTNMFRLIAPGAIGAADGQRWKGLRNGWRAEFMALPAMLDAAAPEKHLDLLLRRIPPGETVDMQTLFINLMTDLAGDVMLGHSLDCQDSHQAADKREFAECLEIVSDGMARTGFLGPAALLLRDKEQARAASYLHRYVERVIRTRLRETGTDKRVADDGKEADKGPPRCLLDSLMLRTNDVTDLSDALLSMLAGANQSVGAMISSAIWLLARHPKVYKDLRQSILDSVGTDPPTHQQIKQLTYLNHVLLEVLRLYPPLPFNARIAKRHTWLNKGGGPGGEDPMVVKKGQCVVFSIWGAQRSRRSFGRDALIFDPGRWDRLKVDAAAFMPFLLGPRQCLGQQFAILESSYFLVRLLQSFAGLEARDVEEADVVVRLSLLHVNGVRVAFTK
ncbi:hypothetical protein CDD83_4547 [Cordyceps sp. RAO-2017]|nr:hypothetical protein CDD83_4547 [Cordyceps sp. RAO-2017]